MQAVIMAGGKGQRLRPLTSLMPKPLVPLMGRSLIEHLLGRVREWGIQEAILTLGYRSDNIRDALGDGSRYGISLTYVQEETPLGTAGGVRQALSLLRGPFLVLSGDGVLDLEFDELVKRHREDGNAVTICLASPESGLQFGLVEAADDGRIRHFVEKPKFADIFPGQGLNTGVYVIERDALAKVPEGVAWDFSHDLFPRLLAHGERVAGYFLTRYWRDVGTVPSYLDAHWDLLSGRVALPQAEVHPVHDGDLGPGVHVTPPVSVGSGSTFGTGVVLAGPLVLGTHAHVEAGCHLSHMVAWENVRIGHGSHLAHLVATKGSRIPPSAHLHGGVVLGPVHPVDLAQSSARFAGGAR